MNHRVEIVELRRNLAKELELLDDRWIFAQSDERSMHLAGLPEEASPRVDGVLQKLQLPPSLVGDGLEPFRHLLQGAAPCQFFEVLDGVHKDLAHEWRERFPELFRHGVQVISGSEVEDS